MSTERSELPDIALEEADRLFCEALELPRERRESYVRDAPGLSSQLRNSVLKLLFRYENLGDFLEVPALDRDIEEFAPGALLADRFTIVKRIGRGGMGEVYLAEDKDLGETVALKTMRADWRADEAALLRFRDEIRLARRIGHPNICRIFELFFHNSQSGIRTAFLTMEYLPGKSLAQALTTGPFAPAEALRIARGIASGLDAAHAAGILHRDLKPSNIILTGETGRPVITDFGLAKPLETSGDSATQTGILAGSPDYMSPEQFLGDPLTQASDVFAFAAILYEMLTGARPWPQESLLRAAVRRITADPASLREARPEIPPQWDRALRRALLKDPVRRTASAGELIADLECEVSGYTSARERVRALRLSAPRPSRRFLLAGASAAICLSCFAVYRRFTDQEAPEAPLLMLTPVHATGDPAVARAVDVLIGKSLVQSAHVRTVPEQKVSSAWTRMGRGAMPKELTQAEWREIALRAGADYVLFQELAWANGEWGVKAVLERLGSSPEHPKSVLLRRFYSSDERGLFTVAAQVADWARAACGEAAGEIAARSRAPEDVTTSSWEALREFTAAIAAWNARPSNVEWPPDQRLAAEGHLKTALEIDHEFSAAAAALADIQVSCQEYDEGLRNYERAAALIGGRNLTDRESLSIRGMFALDSGQYAQARDVFARFAEEYPAMGLPLFHEARAVECLGNAAGALHLLDQAVKKEPDNYAFLIDRGIRYIFMGDFTSAQRDCDRAARMNPSDWVDHARSALAFARGDLAEVWSRLEHMRTSGSVDYRGKALALQGCLRAEQGRVAEARDLIEQSVRFEDVSNAPSAARAPKLQLLARLLLSQGETQAALKVCRELAEGAVGIRPRLEAGALCARAGDHATARRCMPAGIPSDPPASLPRSFGSAELDRFIAWPVYFRRILSLWAEMALSAGDPATAFRLIAAAPPPEASQEWPDLLVRSSVASGERSTAATRITGLLNNPAAYWITAALSAPGFMRRAVLQARELGLAEPIRRPLEKMLYSQK
jgi:tetratricopeptide (TPR) repeat protein